MKFSFSAAGRVLGAALLALAFGGHGAAADTFGAETFTLDNGLEVVVVPNHRAPVVHHAVWYRVGAADEPPAQSGIAHFLEHLMFKGTPSVPAGEFSRIVQRHGGNDNAFTSQDYTGYFQNIARDRLELVMEMEADRMVNLIIDPDSVAAERDVVLEERRSRTDNRPRSLLGEQVNAAQYLAHSYRLPVIGWEHEIRALDRDGALAFYRQHYAPNNAILIVTGDITADELRPLAERYYGVIPPGDAIVERRRPQEPPQRAARRVELSDPQVAQIEWSRSYLAPSFRVDPDGHAEALEILAQILGGGSTSRIYQALVVEEGLATSAGAFYSPTSYDQTRFSLWAAAADGIEVDAIEAAMEREIAAIVANGVTGEELATAKRKMRADAIYAADSVGTVARIFGAALSTGATVKDVEAWPDRIEAVTAEQVQAAAEAVLRLQHSVTGVLLPQPSA